MNTAESYQLHRDAGKTHEEAIRLVREEQRARAEKAPECVRMENDLKHRARA